MEVRAKFRDFVGFREDVSCMTGCPINTDSGMYVQQIANGKYEDAYLTARSPNPFASSCGLICAAPCEDACRRGAVDEPVSIRSLKKFVTEMYGPESNKPDTVRRLFSGELPDSNVHNRHIARLQGIKTENGSKNIAVIGAGPAGLTAAHDLAILGYKVTVFEALGITGGQMRVGIPPYRLPDHVLDSEVEFIESLGVEIKLNTPITGEKGISWLKSQGFSAVFISVGLMKGRLLNMEGSDLHGVHSALEYLNKAGLGETTDTGKRVVVIGGGLVAMDAAREARRQLMAIDINVKYDVHVASLESYTEMPAHQSVSGRQELEETEDEDIHFHPSWGPHRVIGENGKVTGIELIKVLSVFDADGRFSPKFDENQKKVIPCDSVIFAIGQMADLSFITEQDGVTISPRGIIEVDEKFMTSSPGVFAGGDAAFGPRNAIDGVAHGKKAAVYIDEFLTGHKRSTEYEARVEILHTPSYSMIDGYDLLDRKTPPVADPKDRIGKQMIELSFDEKNAVEQAARCLTCHVSPVYDSDLCIICGRCVDICPQQCLSFVPLSEVQIEGVEDMTGFAGGLDLDVSDDITVMVKDDEKCIRCALCATRCPTDALQMERVIVEERPVEVQ